MRSTFTKILVNYTSEESFLTTVNNKLYCSFFFFAKDFLPLLLRLILWLTYLLWLIYGLHFDLSIFVTAKIFVVNFSWEGGGGLKTLLFSPTSLLTFVKLIPLLCLIYSGNDF